MAKWTEEPKLHCMLRENGVAILKCPGDSEGEWQQSVVRAMSPLGRQIRVFMDRPLWRDVAVDPTRAPDRSEGTGKSPLHMDFVNAQFPPEYVCLLCIVPDPLGGGESTFSPIYSAVGKLSAEDVALLARPVYRDGKVDRLENIGKDINPFSVYSPNETFPYRYTGQLLRSTVSPEEHAALSRLSIELDALAESHLLQPGFAIFFDQRRWVHGKAPLGQGQQLLKVDERRLLKHAFFRETT